MKTLVQDGKLMALVVDLPDPPIPDYDSQSSHTKWQAKQQCLQFYWPGLTFRFLELEDQNFEGASHTSLGRPDLDVPVSCSDGVIIVPYLKAFFELDLTKVDFPNVQLALDKSTNVLLEEARRVHGHKYGVIAFQRDGTESGGNAIDPRRTSEVAGLAGGNASLKESTTNQNTKDEHEQSALAIEYNNDASDGDHFSRYRRPSPSVERSSPSAESESMSEGNKGAERNPLYHVPEKLITEYFNSIPGGKFDVCKKGNDFACNGKYPPREQPLAPGLRPEQIIAKYPNHLAGDVLVYIVDKKWSKKDWQAGAIREALPKDFVASWNSKEKAGRAKNKANTDNSSRHQNTFTKSLKTGRRSVLAKMRSKGLLKRLDFELNNDGLKIGRRKTLDAQGGNGTAEKSLLDDTSLRPGRSDFDRYIQGSKTQSALKMVNSTPNVRTSPTILTSPMPFRPLDTSKRKRADETQVEPLEPKKTKIATNEASPVDRLRRYSTEPAMLPSYSDGSEWDRETFQKLLEPANTHREHQRPSPKDVIDLTGNLQPQASIDLICMPEGDVDREGFDIAYPDVNARSNVKDTVKSIAEHNQHQTPTDNFVDSEENSSNAFGQYFAWVPHSMWNPL